VLSDQVRRWVGMATLIVILICIWQNLKSSQPRRVFLMDVEDELAKVEEEFYGSYQTTPEKKCFGNFVFTVI
jgi:hypothetical protein